MSLLPIPKDDAEGLLAHANDAETMQVFKSAIIAMITEFYHVHRRAPVVLCLGARNMGLQARFCLEANAHHVVLCDCSAETLALVASQLSSVTEDNTRFTIVVKSSLQLPVSEQYDMLVHDMFGATLNSGGAAGYVWDLLSRGIIRQHQTPDGSSKRYVLPMEGSMTARLYHVPALTVNQRFGDLGADQNDVPQKKIKWQHDSNLTQLVLAEGNATALSERVEVLCERYDELVESVTWPSNVQLWPTNTEAPLDECLIVLEWSVALNNTGTLSVGTVLGCERTADSRSRRARAIAWGHEYAPLSSVTDTLAPMALSVAYRPAGGLSMNVVASMPSSVTTKTLNEKKLKALAESTYTKVAMQNKTK